MPAAVPTRPLVAIACGGTGGHLFPGVAIAERLLERDCDVTLLVSPKEVDQQAVKNFPFVNVVTLPAVALQAGNLPGFLAGAWQSYRVCRRAFRERPPRAVLAMGSFTSAPPIFAGRWQRAATFLHEGNAVPGRANRWLARWVDEVFVTFPAAGPRLSTPRYTVTGMPVRPQFKPAEAGACRMALGLAADRPVLLVTGGSQGAAAVNELVRQALPEWRQRAPELQYLHLTGPHDLESIRAAYAAVGARAQVFPFLTEMELALGAATVAISRAGASSLAELAALRVPSILIPYPAAADHHQFFNARSFVEIGAARQLEQRKTSPEQLARVVLELLASEPLRQQMGAALAGWHVADAAEQIAARMLHRLGIPTPTRATGEADADALGARPPRRDLARKISAGSGNQLATR